MILFDDEDLNEIREARGIVVQCASEIAPRQQEWLWHQTIPDGCLTLLSGMPKSGKSTLACSLIASALGDRPWPDGRVSELSGDVVMVALEDDWATTTVPRLLAAGVKDLSRVRLARVSALDDLLMLFDPKPALVIIDPLLDLLQVEDTKNMKRVGDELQRVVDLAREHDIAIIGIAHDRKSTEGGALDRVLGSRAFTSKPRAIIQCGPAADADDGSMVAAVTASNAPSHGFFYRLKSTENGAVCIEWLRTVDGDADNLLANRGTRERKRKRDSAEAYLRAVLLDGPKPSKELLADAKEYGITARTLHRAREMLGVRIIKEGRTSLWELPTREERLRELCPDIAASSLNSTRTTNSCTTK